MLGVDSIKKYQTPMDPDYHPELDDSAFLEPDQISQYKPMLGSVNWVLTLGRFDIAYALNTMSRYSMAPREGHFKAMKRVIGYLRAKPNGQLLVDVSEPSIRNEATVNMGQCWSELSRCSGRYPNGLASIKW